METSPANRLPEADSLPDGFVESSGDLSLAEAVEPPSLGESEYKSSLLDVDGPVPHALSGEASHTDDGWHVVEKPTIAADQPDEARCSSESHKEAEGGECRNSEQDREACLNLHTANLVEGTIVQKGSSEVKRKVVKRSAKSEKELSELTLKYHKVIAERDAAVLVKEKLESLCRELQRQNKVLMNECQRVATEGQTMRMDLSAKFNDAIKDVSKKLDEQKDECLSQLQENEMLRTKLKHLTDQYTLTEQQFSQQLKQKMLELQLADLKLQQQRERSVQDQTQLQLYVEQVAQLLDTEKNLRSQLASDGEKFQQFQDALSKSNEVFETFKLEMEKMGKLIKDLKKENQFLKSKCEKSDVAIVKLIEEREVMKKQHDKIKNQKEKLESLCRSLQAERKQNNSVNINCDPQTTGDKLCAAEEDSES